MVSRRGVHQLLGLAQVEQSAIRHPVWRDLVRSSDSWRVSSVRLRNFQFVIEFAQATGTPWRHR